MSDTWSATNRDSVAMPAGTPVGLTDNLPGCLRSAARPPYLACFGLVQADTLPGSIAEVQVNGFLTLSDWTRVTGFATLPIGQTFYLSSEQPGKLVLQPNLAPGGLSQSVGYSLDNFTMLIDLGPPTLT